MLGYFWAPSSQPSVIAACCQTS